jgi:hypothetical protein
MMGDGSRGMVWEVGAWMLEVGGGRRGRQFGSPSLTSAFSCFIFLFSCFMFHIPNVIFSYFENISGMNNVGSFRKMFDRTAGCIKRTMDWLIWMIMSDGQCAIGDGQWVMGQGAGYRKLDVGGWRWDEVAGVAGSVHINSPLLFLCHFSFFMFYVSYSKFRISCFKNTSGMNNMDSLRKIFDGTAGYIKQAMG